MRTCPHCGRENRDDVWVCGSCGEPLTGGTERDESGEAGARCEPAAPSAPDSYGYGGVEYALATGPASQSSASGKPDRSSRLVWVVAGAGLAIVAAIVLVWFFALRSTGGGEFIGAWQAPGTDISTVSIARAGDTFKLTFTSANSATAQSFKAELNGDRLETKLEPIAKNEDERAAAVLFQALLAAAIDDFKMVFTYRAADGKLILRVEGAPRAGAQPSAGWDQPVELTRAR